MIPRPQYLNKLIGFKDKQLIKIVTGIRRCGKSTLNSHELARIYTRILNLFVSIRVIRGLSYFPDHLPITSKIINWNPDDFIVISVNNNDSVSQLIRTPEAALIALGPAVSEMDSRGKPYGLYPKW